MAPINPINDRTPNPTSLTSPTPTEPAGTEQQSPAPPDPRADQAAMVEMVAQMQEAISGAAAAPHTVAFRQEGPGNEFVIEIRDPQGELIKQFPPEKVLNLRRKLAELTGMVIDQMT